MKMNVKPGTGYDFMERGRDSVVVDQYEGRVSKAAVQARFELTRILDCI